MLAVGSWTASDQPAWNSTGGIHFTVQRDLVAQATGRELRDRF